ncbi:hypothetical protein Tco_1192190 [Tanacetum coccineum]
METPPAITSVRNLTAEVGKRDKQASDAWNTLAIRHAETTGGTVDRSLDKFPLRIQCRLLPSGNSKLLHTSSPDDDKKGLTINTKPFGITKQVLSHLHITTLTRSHTIHTDTNSHARGRSWDPLPRSIVLTFNFLYVGMMRTHLYGRMMSRDENEDPSVYGMMNGG